MDITILRLCETDAGIMAGIAAKSHSHPMSEANIASCFGRFYLCFGIYHNQQLLGYVILFQLFEQATIIDICIEPENLGMGLGKRLMQHAINQMKQTEAEMMLLEVRQSNERAIALYQHLGFVNSGIRKNYYKTTDGNEDAILMNLLLA